MSGRTEPRALAVFASALAIAALAAGLGPVGGAAKGGKPPPVSRSYYLTASSASDLTTQAEDIGKKFAQDAAPGHQVLLLDFGAARAKGSSYGSSLRGGTFFTNDNIQAALEAAAKGHHEAYKRGSVTIVYANSNADLANPEGGNDFTAFTESIAQDAGEDQAKTAAAVKTFSHQSMGIGGDIEPGLEGSADPDIPIAMVEAAIDEGNGMPYYDVGTAPCGQTQCFGQWTVKDICSVTTGEGRHPLPEIYFDYQLADWDNVRQGCGIKNWAGVSSSTIGNLKPEQSWTKLGKATHTPVGPVLLSFPGVG